MYIFLDIDGVLRKDGPGSRTFLPPCCKNLYNAIKGLEHKIVITSTWREAFTISEIKSYFPEYLKSMIIGTTPILRDEHETPARYREIRMFLRSNKIQDHWIAIDDKSENFPSHAPVILVDGQIGFSESNAELLKSIT